MVEAGRNDRQIALEQRFDAAGGRGPETHGRGPHFEKRRGRALGVVIIRKLQRAVGGDADVVGMVADANDLARLFHTGHNAGHGLVAGIVFLGQFQIAQNVFIGGLQLFDALGRQRFGRLFGGRLGKENRSGQENRGQRGQGCGGIFLLSAHDRSFHYFPESYSPRRKGVKPDPEGARLPLHDESRCPRGFDYPDGCGRLRLEKEHRLENRGWNFPPAAGFEPSPQRPGSISTLAST